MAIDTGADSPLVRRLRASGWGLFLVWTGALLLAPGELPFLWYAWLAGIGVIVLGFAVLGVALGLRWDWDGIILGVAAALSGFGGLAGLSISFVGLILAFFGASFLVSVARSWLRTPVGPRASTQ